MTQTKILLDQQCLACVTSWPSAVSQMLCRSRSHAPANWVSLLAYRGGSDWVVQQAEASVLCFSSFFFFLFFLLCFAKVGFVEGNHRWVHVTGGRETCRLGSARVYVLSIFPEVSILQTWPFPVSFLLALIFLEIVPKWESTVLGPDNNSTNL